MSDGGYSRKSAGASMWRRLFGGSRNAPQTGAVNASKLEAESRGSAGLSQLAALAGPGGTAAATILALVANDEIQDIRDGGNVIGFWIKAFPQHIDQGDFIKAYFKLLGSEQTSSNASRGSYCVSTAFGRGGYIVNVGNSAAELLVRGMLAEHGPTSIHVFARAGDNDLLREMVAAGADIEARDKEGRTALRWAVDLGHAKSVEFLLGAGADKEARDAKGHTALQTAAAMGYFEVARVLLSAGADSNVEKNTGATPLHLAAMKGNSEIVEALLKNGADPDAHDPSADGCTPLHGAVIKGHAKVVELLLAAGANHAATSRSGWTPIKIAEGTGDREILSMLKRFE